MHTHAHAHALSTEKVPEQRCKRVSHSKPAYPLSLDGFQLMEVHSDFPFALKFSRSDLVFSNVCAIVQNTPVQ